MAQIFPVNPSHVPKEKEEKQYGEYLIKDDGRDRFVDAAYLGEGCQKRISTRERVKCWDVHYFMIFLTREEKGCGSNINGDALK